MPKLRLTYFNIKGSRGQVARHAFELADLAYEDNRISFTEFVEKKDSFPFGAIPILEVDGQVIAQSNGINRYVGKLCDLYPSDPLQAAFCDEAMSAVEDILVKGQATMHISDAEEKKQAREKLAEGPIPFFLKSVAARLEARGGEFFADNKLTVADIKVFLWIRSLNKGVLDHVPSDIVAQHAPILQAHHDRIWSIDTIRKHYDD